MKLNKKFLACFMAATMAIAPMTAFGDNASTQVDVDGVVTDVDTEQYNIILPTSENLQFNVDPYGILTRNDGDTLSDVLTSVASGEAGIVTSTATAIINKSSVGINVQLSTYLTASGVTINLANNEEEAKSGTKDLYLAIAQVSGASVSITTAGAIVSGSSVWTTDLTGDSTKLVQGVNAASGNAISVTGGTLELSPTAITATSSSAMTTRNIPLKDMADAYELTGTAFVLSEGAVAANINNDNTFAFAITGYANPNSDVWENLTTAGSLKLTMKFDISGGEATGPFDNLTVPRASNSDLSVPTTQMITGLVINSYPGAANANIELSSNQFRSTDSSFTILGSYIQGWVDTGDYVFTATYSDGTTKTFTVKCQ